MRFIEFLDQVDIFGRPKSAPKPPPATQANPIKKMTAPVANYRVSRGITRDHQGVDLVVPEGTELLAPEDGVCIDNGGYRKLGEFVKLKTATGIHKFGHLQINSVTPRVGQTVKQGQVLARTGNTGRSTGPHLHWELWVNGQVVDPLKYL